MRGLAVNEIQQVYVFLGQTTGGEGIAVMRNGEVLMPLVCFHEDSLKLMRENARAIAATSAIAIRLVKFTNCVEIEKFSALN